ncbi:MAG: twin-arginine translocase subunit TatC [Haloferacaceae archaeon]
MTEDRETPDSAPDAADGGSDTADSGAPSSGGDGANGADSGAPSSGGDGANGDDEPYAPPESLLSDAPDPDDPAPDTGFDDAADAPEEPGTEVGAAVEGAAPSGEAAPNAPDSVVADGAAAPAEAPGTAGAPTSDDYLSDFEHEGPEEDVEMPLADHIEEMISRLGVVFLVGGVVLLATFPFAEELINYLWNTHIPGASTIADRRPRLYGPLELLLTKLKVAGLAGLLAGLPVLVYQSYRFMRPGLYPHERRYYLAAVPTSLVLGFVGVSFAHFVVLPAIFAYFTSYTTGTALVAFGLRETFNLILLLMGYMAVVFQIPLFIMLGIMMGLVTRGWLEDKRLLFWGAFAGLSFLVSPDPTGMAPIIVTVTMITLYEGTLALLRWTGN